MQQVYGATIHSITYLEETRRHVRVDLHLEGRDRSFYYYQTNLIEGPQQDGVSSEVAQALLEHLGRTQIDAIFRRSSGIPLPGMEIHYPALAPSLDAVVQNSLADRAIWIGDLAGSLGGIYYVERTHTLHLLAPWGEQSHLAKVPVSVFRVGTPGEVTDFENRASASGFAAGLARFLGARPTINPKPTVTRAKQHKSQSCETFLRELDRIHHLRAMGTVRM